MQTFLGFGDGHDGILHITTNTTDAPIDAVCTGIADSTTLNATNASFAAGQKVFIHQTQGTGHGHWEIGQIHSYSVGAIILEKKLDYDYVAGAQVIVMKEYSGIVFDAACFLSPKAWNGTLGGIIAYCNSGDVSGSSLGGFKTAGAGFRGGSASVGGSGNQGESFVSGVSGIAAANNSGGGGCPVPAVASGPGAGAGYLSAGTNGLGGSNGSVGGAVCGTADLLTLELSSGGGGSTSSVSAANGGRGSGIVVLFTRTCTLTIFNLDAQAVSPSGQASPGAGAAGSALIITQQATLGTNLISAASYQPAASSIGWVGGKSSKGRVHISTCSIVDAATYTSTLAIDFTLGGHAFCLVPGQII